MSDTSRFPDWRPAPNIRDRPDLYELENEALDPAGLVLRYMRETEDWAGKDLVDLGCGTGYWLETYARDARTVYGIEPDRALREAAQRRQAPRKNVIVLAGSAEHMPLANQSVDVVHARFAYFFGPGCEAGLAEVLRILRPEGTLLVIDNDLAAGEFAELLPAVPECPDVPHESTTGWWAARGAAREAILSEWRFRSREDLEAVLRNEFRDGSAEGWLKQHPKRTHITYSFAVYSLRRAGQLAAGQSVD